MKSCLLCAQSFSKQHSVCICPSGSLKKGGGGSGGAALLAFLVVFAFKSFTVADVLLGSDLYLSATRFGVWSMAQGHMPDDACAVSWDV